MPADKTIAVVGLDAADYRLVTRWGCENIQLDRAARLETFAHSIDVPHTIEVWPTIATGQHPREHGVEHRTASPEWEASGLQTVSSAARRIVPMAVRQRAGSILERLGAGHSRASTTTDSRHVFDALFEWPGVVKSPHFGAAVRLAHQAHAGEIQTATLEKRLFTQTQTAFEWLRNQGPGLIGTHVHVLDVGGHVYAKREDELRHYYERVDSLLGALRYAVDDLVILSDHGMQVDWLGDENPGTHSFEAVISTTLDSPLPESVFDVADWLRTAADETETGQSGDTSERGDTPAAVLRDLYGHDIDQVHRE